VTSFTENLVEGRIGEGQIALWLNSRGWNVLPAYEIEIETGKGPRFFTAKQGQLVTPDLLVFKSQEIMWVEAKRKSAFTWYRKTNGFQTGIDKRHWEHYLEVKAVSQFPLWLLFLHGPGEAKDTPEGKVSPSGLYGGEIDVLQQSIDHTSDRWGASGMVYWRKESLTMLATYENLNT